MAYLYIRIMNFKKFHHWGKFLFLQLVTKNHEFTSFQWNSMLTLEKNMHVKISAMGKVHVLIFPPLKNTIYTHILRQNFFPFFVRNLASTKFLYARYFLIVIDIILQVRCTSLIFHIHSYSVLGQSDIVCSLDF